MLPLGGCGHATTVPVRAPAAQTPERIEVPRVIVTPDSATSIDELFARAQGNLDAQRYAEAVTDFERVYELDPRGPLAADALFGQASAYDLGAHPIQALQSYQALASRFPASTHARTALVRSTRLYAFLEHYPEAGQVADLVMGRFQALRPFEAISVYGAKALSLVASGNVDKADYYVGKARTIIEDNGLDAAGEVPRDLAQVYFALGEIRRVRAERIKFVPLPSEFAAVLEQRCQLILDAQTGYSDAMRAHDAHWSAMAGYRIGELYQKLHEDLMQVPPPEAADSPFREQLFEGAMRLRYSILLEKAHSMMSHTIRMGQRTGERSVWIAKAEQSLKALDEAMRREQAALDALPYSRAQLQQALDDLERRTASAAP